MYRITIVEIREETVIERGAWDVIDKRPYTDEEVAEANKSWQSRVENPETAIKSIYGYLPARETTKKVEREVYKQEVDELDLYDVIRAVNGE